MTAVNVLTKYAAVLRKLNRNDEADRWLEQVKAINAILGRTSQ